MKKINIIKTIVLSLFMTISFVSCDEGGDPDPGGTAIQDMSGDWFVQEATDGVGSGDYYLISTYNTVNDNGTEMWIDDGFDLNNRSFFWVFKVKCPVNASSLTFSGNDLASSVELPSSFGGGFYDLTATVTNGQVIMDGATTDSGNPSDKISLDIEFSDDAGTVYSLVGYRRTGLLEDEH